jgi:uncharacterized protein (TIGR03067 family)
MRLLALLAAGLLAGGSIADDKKPKDEEAILGTWRIEKIDDGKEGAQPAKKEGMRSMTFAKEGKLSVTMGGGDEHQGKYELDSTAKPKRIDMSSKEGTTLALYELDGDTLSLAVCAEGQTARPTAFKADGESTAVWTLKRVKDDPKAKDKEAILGAWQMEKIDRGKGETTPKVRITFGKDGQMLYAGPDGEVEGKYTLDPTDTPKAMNMSTENGIVPAIYSLDGDTLTIAVGTGKKVVRPDQLKADGKAIEVWTLKRVQDQKKDK